MHVRIHPSHPGARAGLAHVAGIVAVVGAASLALGAKQAELTARLDEQQIVLDGQRASLDRLQPLDEHEVEDWRRERERIAHQLAIFDKLERARHGVVRALDATIGGQMLPPRPGDRHALWVSSYRESGGYVHLRGGAINNADISTFMRSLQKSDQFSDVQLCFTRCNDEVPTAAQPWFTFEVGSRVDYSR